MESLGAGAFRVTAYGGGQDNFSDLGHFAWREVYGDFDARVRVSSLTAPGSFTRAGLMVRESLEPDARMSFAFVFPAGPADDGFPGKNGYAFDRRSGTGTQTLPQMEISSEAPFPNAWLRLRRVGNVLSFFRSNDGQAWTQLLSQDTGLPPVVYLGLGTQAARYETDVFTVAEYHDFEVRHATPQSPANISVEESMPLAITFLAQDFDRPAQRLSYSLVTPPAGATLNPATGHFTWTPNEAQGPGAHSITVRATDNGEPPASAEQTLIVTVNEVNSRPVMTAIPNQSATEGSPFTFQPAVTDSDLPANALIWSLGQDAPAGLTIDAATGELTWGPGETQGGASHPVIVTVTDQGSPPLSDTKMFTITVEEANMAPELKVIRDRTVDELSEIIFAAAASDGDQPMQQVTFSLAPGAAEGATISSEGVFRWTPTEAQGPGAFPITVRATDDGTPPLSAEQTFNVTVREVNRPPKLAEIPDQVAEVGRPFTFTVTASDDDLPANNLTYFLGDDAPAAATLSESGVLAWTPAPTEAGTTQTVTLYVEDNGMPVLRDARSVQITVAQTPSVPPALSVHAEGGTLIISFPSQAGRTYQLQSRADLSPGPWENEGDAQIGNGGLVTFQVPVAGSSLYLRVQAR